MPWFKVDDKLHSHMKVAEAGDAMALWVVAGSWCSDQLTDGFVPEFMAERLVPGGQDMAMRLVEAGLWVEAEVGDRKGWRFHQWGERNPTAVEVEAKREAARERMRKVRSNKQEGSEEVRANEDRSNGDGSPYPEPEPVPTPEGQNQPPASSADADNAKKPRTWQDDPEFVAWWEKFKATTRGRAPTGAPSRAWKPWKRLTIDAKREAYRSLETYGALLYALDHGRKPNDPHPNQHGSTWLNDRRWESVADELEAVQARARPQAVDRPTCDDCGQYMANHNDRACQQVRAG